MAGFWPYMILVLLSPKNLTASGSSLGEKELLAAYEDDEPRESGVLARFLLLSGLSNSGFLTGSSSCMRAATVAAHFGVSSTSGVLAGTMQHRMRQRSAGL